MPETMIGFLHLPVGLVPTYCYFDIMFNIRNDPQIHSVPRPCLCSGFNFLGKQGHKSAISFDIELEQVVPIALARDVSEKWFQMLLKMSPNAVDSVSSCSFVGSGDSWLSRASLPPNKLPSGV